jgi:hypothetical protein
MAKAWKIWVCQFDWHEAASRFILRGAEVQVGILMSSLGPGMTEIFDAFGLSTVEEKVVATIRRKLEEHFALDTNISLQRLNLFRMRQLETQKFDEYLVQVKAQAKKCEFGELEDSLVKEVIVLRTRSVRE